MLSEKFKTSIMDFMVGLNLEKLDAYDNVWVRSEKLKKDIQAPLVCLTGSMVYIFMPTTLTLDPSAEERKSSQSLLSDYENAFASYLEVRSGQIVLFAVNEQGDDTTVVYYLRPGSNNLVLLNSDTQNGIISLFDLITTQESYFERVEATEEAFSRGLLTPGTSFFEKLSLKLEFASRDGERIKYDLLGNAYIQKRNNTWVRASTEDGNKLFLLTTLGGFLGAHLFYQKKKAKGVLYLLTCGFFGVGWIFDAIELLVGIRKDKNGYYIIPPKLNFIRITLCFALGAILTLGLGMLYKALFSLGNNFLQAIISSAASELSSAHS